MKMEDKILHLFKLEYSWYEGEFQSTILATTREKEEIEQDIREIANSRRALRLKKLFDRINRCIFHLTITRRHPLRKIIQLLIVNLYPPLIPIEKIKHRGHCNSFVSILKWMILDHEIKKNGRFFDQSFV